MMQEFFLKSFNLFRTDLFLFFKGGNTEVY